MITSGTKNFQRPSGMPTKKYVPFRFTTEVEADEKTRQWPNKKITKAPRWLSTDLRDGNQALVDPMDPHRKKMLFKLLVDMGYKEIEVGFPAASQTDYDFVRALVDENLVPDDVTVSVLTQSRKDLITPTIEALRGLKRATVHLYNATSPMFREVVFRKNKEETIELATSGTKSIMDEAERILGDETIFGFEYSPEIFIDTEPDFALEICEAVMDVWQPGPDREIILNLPATIERSTPNVYADQIEYMSNNLSRRQYISLSVHPHNDRGTAVAAAELAMMAGADRVEGCLFGQGERTGNVDLITLALNLYTQGVDPQIKLQDIDEVRRTVEYCTGMPVPARTPYAGDLVYTSFSGSHQDAIKKGFAARDLKLEIADDPDSVVWEMPYLPIDPHDVGRSYEAVVRVNSQSGKGGVAFIMSGVHNLELPRNMQVEFSQIVQAQTEQRGGEVDPDAMWDIFADTYLSAEDDLDGSGWGRFKLGRTTVTADEDGARLRAELIEEGETRVLAAAGNGPVDAFAVGLKQLGYPIKILDYTEHAMGAGRTASAAAYIEADIGGRAVWGVGIDPSIARASYKAMISALNRVVRD